MVAATAAGNGLAVTIDAASPLAAVGSLALAQSSNALVLVAHTGQDTFTALSARCTHASCTVSAYSGQTFICPCHGSQFNASGQVVGGPAPSSLAQYHTLFANSVLTITP